MTMTNPSSSTSLPRLFSIQQVAELTGLSRRTITMALSSGDLDHYRMGTRAVIPEPAVVAWLEANRVGKRARMMRKTVDPMP